MSERRRERRAEGTATEMTQGPAERQVAARTPAERQGAALHILLDLHNLPLSLSAAGRTRLALFLALTHVY
jgi:hypothetical protein